MHKYSIGLCIWNVNHVGKHKWVNPQDWSCALSIILCFHVGAIWWCWQQNSGSVRTLLSPGTNNSWHTLTVRPVNLIGTLVLLSSSSLAITTIHYILHYRLSPSSTITYIVYMLNTISGNHENISVFLTIFPHWNCTGNWIPVSYVDLLILHDQCQCCWWPGDVRCHRASAIMILTNLSQNIPAFEQINCAHLFLGRLV